MEKRIGDVSELNKRSAKNRQCVSDWVAAHPLFELGVQEEESRGAAVTLLKVNDPDITAPDIHARIIAKSKQLLGYAGILHPNGQHESGLDVARYVNAFPGTPGDFRAWIGGIRTESDITALLDNLEYTYHRAKIVVLEEELAQQGITFEPPQGDSANLETQMDFGENQAALQNLAQVTAKEGEAENIRQTLERLAAIWGALTAIKNPERRAELLERYGSQLIQDSNRYASLIEALGLRVPEL